MTTPASLWQRLDDAYLAAILAAMGQSSSYTDLQLQTGEIAATWAPDRGPFPRAIVVSDKASLQHGGHAGKSAIHLAVTYEYFAVAIAEAPTYTDAKAAAQELHDRLLSALQTWPAILATAAAAGNGSSSVPIRHLWGDSWIDVRGRQSGNAGKHYGQAIVQWSIEGSR